MNENHRKMAPTYTLIAIDNGEWQHFSKSHYICGLTWRSCRPAQMTHICFVLRFWPLFLLRFSIDCAGAHAIRFSSRVKRNVQSNHLRITGDAVLDRAPRWAIVRQIELSYAHSMCNTKCATDKKAAMVKIWSSRKLQIFESDEYQRLRGSNIGKSKR